MPELGERSAFAETDKIPGRYLFLTNREVGGSPGLLGRIFPITGLLQRHGIQISMDRKPHWVDSVFFDRLWRSLKYEEIYLKVYGSIIDIANVLCQSPNRQNESWSDG